MAFSDKESEVLNKLQQNQDDAQKDKMAQLPGAVNATMEDLDKLGLPQESAAAFTPNAQPVQQSLADSDPMSDYQATLDKYKAMSQPLMTSNMGTAADVAANPDQDKVQSQAAAPTSKSIPSVSGMSGGSSDQDIFKLLQKDQSDQKMDRLAAQFAHGGERAGAALAGGALQQLTPDYSASKELEEGAKSNYQGSLDIAKLKQANDLKKAQLQSMLAQRQLVADQRQALIDSRNDIAQQSRLRQHNMAMNYGIMRDPEANLASKTLGNASSLEAFVLGNTKGQIPSAFSAQEMAALLDRTLRNGQSAVATIHDAQLKDALSSGQKLMEFITSKPQAVQRPEYMAIIKNLLGREEQRADALLKDKKLNYVVGMNAKDQDAFLPAIQQAGIADKYTAIKNGDKVGDRPYLNEVRQQWEKGGALGQTPSAAKMSDDDQQAKDWTTQHPNDPRSQQILDMLKSKGF